MRSTENRGARSGAALIATLLSFGVLERVAPAQAAPQAITPFSASYSVEWKGLNAASASLQLKQTAPGAYTYVSRNTARGIFSLAFPDDVLQTSELVIDDSGVRPVRYRGDDGSEDTARDVSLDFSWSLGRVTGTVENRPVDLAVQPGVQDAMSIQIALMLDLAAGRTPTVYWMMDKDKLKDYVYEQQAGGRLKTAVGQLDTVVWASHRPGSNRITRIWYAPSIGYVPVKAERTKGGKIEWTMRLRSLAR